MFRRGKLSRYEENLHRPRHEKKPVRFLPKGHYLVMPDSANPIPSSQLEGIDPDSVAEEAGRYIKSMQDPEYRERLRRFGEMVAGNS